MAPSPSPVTATWTSILCSRVLADAGYQGWLLVEAEQDPAKANPLEYAMKARKYIREHTGL